MRGGELWGKGGRGHGDSSSYHCLTSPWSSVVLATSPSKGVQAKACLGSGGWRGGAIEPRDRFIDRCRLSVVAQHCVCVLRFLWGGWKV